MDRKKSNTAASGSQKHEDEKDENFFKKTANSIRVKLRLKKKKKNTDSKSKPAKTGKTDLSSTSNDEGSSPDLPRRISSPAESIENTETEKDLGASSSSSSSANPSNQTSVEQNTNDKVHLSFHGVSTVDDLLDRIDEAIESAKIVIEGDTNKTLFSVQGKSSKPRPSPADLDKKPLEKSEGNETKTNDQENKKNDREGEGEPLRIDYNEIHRIEDLLDKVYGQPGDRKIVLENAPDNDESVSVEKKTSLPPTRASTANEHLSPPPPPTTTTTATASNDNDDSSAPLKSILKTSQDPSSLDTSTKVASFQDDQIHVNIEGVQNVDDLLDRIDEAVQNIPIVIETTITQEKQETSPVTVENNNDNQNISVSSLKHEGNDIVSETISSSSTSDEKKNGDEKSDWV
ncbi:hypothetical protein I4U23_030680 [Adineta vaga]|nr:hypothetical protein I4U23_030680 [Adineta vaga]